jgi:hypothetical protein
MKKYSREKPMNHRLGIFLHITLAAACAMLTLAPAARAQSSGSRKDDVVLNARGLPLAGATIRVCTAASTGTPCSPLAPIYSDQALTQALANPTTSDGMGNYNFYAVPGRYKIEISGPGITTRQIPDVILPNDPSAPTFTSLTTTSGINAFSLTLSGNLTVAGSAAITGALTVNGGPVPSTGAANTWTASQYFKGPVPWVDITAYGATCAGSGSAVADLAAMNSAVAAVTGSGSGGTVYIPWTANYCNFTGGSLTMTNSSGNWLNIVQAGTIKVDHPIAFDKYTQWEGIGGYGPTSFQYQSAAAILSTGNINTININGVQDVVLKNVVVIPDGFQTSAHTIALTNIVNVTFENVSGGANGTGDFIHADDGPSAGFGFYYHGGSCSVSTTNINHSCIYIRDIGIVNIAPDFIGHYGIHVVDDISAGGELNMTIGCSSPNQITTEALHDTFLILDQTAGTSGISGITVCGLSLADNTGSTYIVKAIGAGTAEIGNIYLSDINGQTDIGDPTSTRTVAGVWTSNVAGTIPSGWSGGTQYNHQTIFYGVDKTHAPLNVANGPIVAGGAQAGQDSNHFIDPVNGGNGISYTTYSPGLVERLDSANANPSSARELPVNGTWSDLYCNTGGCGASTSYNSQYGIWSSRVTNGVDGSVSGQDIGGFAKGFSTSNDIAFERAGGNRIRFTGAPTADRTVTFQDTAGTVALTSQLPFSGTTSSIGGGSLTAGACTSGTASVTGATTSMVADTSPAADPGAGFTWNAFVSSGGTVTVRVCNVSGATATPTAAAYNVRVIQ